VCVALFGAVCGVTRCDTALHYNAQCFTTYIALHCTLCHTALHYKYCTILYCAALHYAKLRRTSNLLFIASLCGIALYGLTSQCSICPRVVCGARPYSTVQYSTVQCVSCVLQLGRDKDISECYTCVRRHTSEVPEKRVCTLCSPFISRQDSARIGGRKEGGDGMEGERGMDVKGMEEG
jgi:hypothetical protein